MQIQPSISLPATLLRFPAKALASLPEPATSEPSESVQLSGGLSSAPGTEGRSATQQLLETSSDTGFQSAFGAIGGGVSLLSNVKRRFESVATTVSDFVSGETTASWAASRTVKAINALGAQTEKLSDQQLKAKTVEFKQRLAGGESLDDLMVEAYAVVKEAASRQTGLRLYDEQVEGAVHAHHGAVVEMKTGEGKTLMGLLPAYLNALGGDGVQVMTFNDYLAGRDADRARPIFESLDLKVGYIKDGMDTSARVDANKADITYGAASEFGFQYLNDNLALEKAAQVGRDLSKVFVLVDEADSLLLDESRTPLLIAGSHTEDVKPVQVFNEVAKYLVEGQDYETEIDKKTVWLTDSGTERVQKILGLGDLYSEENAHLVPYMDSALRAKVFLQRDEDYIVRGTEVVLIDEFTGRAKEDHHFSQGLQQAVQAREGLPIGETQDVLASITYPNFLSKYRKVAGMTGTAAAARAEFEDLGLTVRKVKTHEPMIRNDRDDVLLASKAERNAAVASRVKELHANGRPVLIGTRSIESSEALSRELTSLGIPHNLLNARQPELEAQVVAQAGRPGAVTIATNMAGRGTDIKLGGDAKDLAAGEAQEKGGSMQDYLPKWQAITSAERDSVLKAGGLVVLGTERHESRRIDEQLIGRAGRQGDPGESQFILSAEDDLFKRNLSEMPKSGGMMTGSLVKRFVAQAQERSESRNLSARRHLLRYDRVRNLQRETVYAQRDAVLDNGNIMDALPELAKRAARSVADQHYDGNQLKDGFSLREHASFLARLPLAELPEFPTRKAFEGWLSQRLSDTGAEKEQLLGSETLGKIMGKVYLQILDDGWSEQQTELETLRDASWMAGLAEQDPLVQYSLRAHEAYESMLDGISRELMTTMLHIDGR